MTNHEYFVEAFKKYGGREFSTAEIKDILLKRFPDFAPGSILPNDHAEGNKHPCTCAGKSSRVFDRVRRGKYRVREMGSDYEQGADLTVQTVDGNRLKRSTKPLSHTSGVPVCHDNVKMLDPLNGFDWTKLTDGYDSRCERFNSNSPHLHAIHTRPSTDRLLYYHLVQLATNGFTTLSVDWYEALLYWKLYSTCPPEKIAQWLRNDESRRRRNSDNLQKLLASLPKIIPREVTQIVNLMERIGNYNIDGMRSHTSLPVRSTFLHMLYPNVVPIIDKMVLKAVGIANKNANQSMEMFRQYLQHAWVLADRHAIQLTGFKETPIRLVDMALWITRASRPS